MSSTSQLTTFSDLYTDLLQRVRVSTSVSATVEQAKRYINIALHDIHLGFDYKLPWCERQTFLRTKAPYSTGTISVTNGSMSVTGTSTVWSTVNAYNETPVLSQGKILIDGSPEVYRVASISSNTAMTLYERFIGDTDTDATYTYFEDEYTLSSDFLRPINFQFFSPLMGIKLIPRNEFRQRFPAVTISGRPRYACLIDSVNTAVLPTPKRRVVFFPYPDQTYNIPYAYITSTIAVDSSGTALTSMSSDTDTPTMPLRYRHAIIFHALSHWYRDKKDDARAAQAKDEYTDIMMRIVGDHDIATHTMAQLRPSMGSYMAAAKAPYRYRGGRRVYDLHDEFDALRR